MFKPLSFLSPLRTLRLLASLAPAWSWLRSFALPSGLVVVLLLGSLDSPWGLGDAKEAEAAPPRSRHRVRRPSKLRRSRWIRKTRRHYASRSLQRLSAHPPIPSGLRKVPNLGCSSLLQRETALRYLQKAASLQGSMNLYLRHLHECRWLQPFDKARILVFDHRQCKLAAINQHLKTSAASLIKPFVMLAIYHEAHKRGIPPYRFPAPLQSHINKMMRVSNNPSTNALIRYLGQGSPIKGAEVINKILRQYGLGKTGIVELIPAGGRTYRNYTTAHDLHRLFALIYQRKAVSPAYSRKMFEVMVASRDNRCRTPYLRSLGVAAATKTGYTRLTNGVAGIVFSGYGIRRHPYTFVAVINRSSGSGNEWIWRKTSTPILQRLSEMTYQFYASKRADAALTSSKKRSRRIGSCIP